MSARLRKALRAAASEGGTSAVEFALVAPVMIMLLLAIMQFGWTQHRLSSVRSAMERANRALLIDPKLTQAAAQAIVTSHLDVTANTDVTVTLTTETIAAGKVARLTAYYVAEFGIPGLASFSIPYRINKTTVLKAAT
ncbi:pilus assembly protein [Phenylobacterium sp. LH3H17]|uniref:TadE/TadG family type IV pilus assembly protein n=1 Tax=Phenylobacterium sp. LH3H17 TaxID=2903901 RepID=UPI0020C98E8F|nr:TadE/TadG family type IV pilus assembly protein [Phenylobacterium sp. LH3H17]UTP40608.1 pilus assembly protein [Phenylobacterium sp. LH3H17]